MNLLDAFIGLMFLVIIAAMVAKWIDRKRRGTRVSWKAIVAWASWGAQFLLYEALFQWDGDPTTPTLSEMMVGSVPLWLMLGGTWFVCGALLVHWWDLDRRLAPLQKMLLESNESLRSAYSIACRNGEQTNWAAFGKNVEGLLERQHKRRFLFKRG
jgi:hypothetical protein